MSSYYHKNSDNMSTCGITKGLIKREEIQYPLHAIRIIITKYPNSQNGKKQMHKSKLQHV